MNDFSGQQIDRYRIIERLGMGGMALVYKAYDLRLERDVAIKMIRTDEIPPSQLERLMKRFEREAKAQSGFSHPSIVPVYDYGKLEGIPYLVLRYLPGGTLKEKLKSPFLVEEALRIIIPISDAVAYAHSKGVLHRDVKPANILFDEEGQPILTDFGIAKILETDEATLTGTGLGVGTPEYMAPEQWQGKTSEASDQYALGVVLYELITGKKPYSADTPAAIILMQATEPLQAPSGIVKGIPEAVEKVLYKALARSPEDRYEDMGAFQGALEELLREAETQEAEKAAEPAEKPAPMPTPIKAVDREGETRDALDATPAEGIQAKTGTQKPTRHGFTKWVLWAGIGIIGLVIIGLAFGIGGDLVDMGKGGEGPLAMLATETSTATVTATPTKTSTPTKTATITSTPETTPSVKSSFISSTATTILPITLLEFLENVNVIETDNFETSVNWNMMTGKIYQYTLVINGDGWNAVTYKETFYEGEGFTIDFKYSEDNSDFEFLFQNGEFYTDPYRRLGIYCLSGIPESNIFFGKEAVESVIISNNFQLSPNTWYTLIMAVGEEGEFISIIWDPENPDKLIQYNRSSNEDWSGYEWELSIGVDNGTVTYDNFSKFVFEGFK